MIEVVNKQIKLFLTSIEESTNDSTQAILNKFTTSISEDLKNGHLTTNVCMVAASILRLNPKELAENLEKSLKKLNKFKKVEAAGPGFVNITLHREDFVSIIKEIMKLEEDFGKSEIGNKKRVQIEFVSANPTGPLHVGHGRGAAYGDAIGRILKSTGHCVDKEYYINDAGRQIDILTASVLLKIFQKEINDFFPQNAYKGTYIELIGKDFLQNNKIKYNDIGILTKNLPSDPEK